MNKKKDVFNKEDQKGKPNPLLSSESDEKVPTSVSVSEWFRQVDELFAMIDNDKIQQAQKHNEIKEPIGYEHNHTELAGERDYQIEPDDLVQNQNPEDAPGWFPEEDFDTGRGR